MVLFCNADTELPVVNQDLQEYILTAFGTCMLDSLRHTFVPNLFLCLLFLYFLSCMKNKLDGNYDIIYVWHLSLILRLICRFIIDVDAFIHLLHKTWKWNISNFIGTFISLKCYFWYNWVHLSFFSNNTSVCRDWSLFTQQWRILYMLLPQV